MQGSVVWVSATVCKAPAEKQLGKSQHSCLHGCGKCTYPGCKLCVCVCVFVCVCVCGCVCPHRLYDTAKVYLLSPGPPHTTSATHTQHTDASTSQTQPTQAATQPQNQQEQQQQQQQGSQGFAGGSGDKGSLTGAAVPAHTVLAPSPADPGAALDGPAGPLAWHPVWTQPHTQVLQGLARAFTAYTHEVPVRTQAETPMQGTNAHGTYNTSSRPITPLTEGLQGSIRSSRPIQKGAQIQQDVAPHGPGPGPQPAQPAVPAAPSHHGLSHLLYAWAVASGVVFLASSVTYPLDVVRKRWVVDAGLANHKYKSAWDCAMGIVRQVRVDTHTHTHTSSHHASHARQA